MTAGELLVVRFGESCRRCGGLYGLDHVPQIMLEEGGSGVMLACHNCGDMVDHLIATRKARRRRPPSDRLALLPAGATARRSAP